MLKLFETSPTSSRNTGNDAVFSVHYIKGQNFYLPKWPPKNFKAQYKIHVNKHHNSWKSPWQQLENNIQKECGTLIQRKLLPLFPENLWLFHAAIKKNKKWPLSTKSWENQLHMPLHSIFLMGCFRSTFTSQPRRIKASSVLQRLPADGLKFRFF